jgi:hypothetical protein
MIILEKLKKEFQYWVIVIVNVTLTIEISFGRHGRPTSKSYLLNLEGVMQISSIECKKSHASSVLR